MEKHNGMKILLKRHEDGNIVVMRDYTSIHSRGEISHMIAEIENIKLDLLSMWEEFEGE